MSVPVNLRQRLLEAHEKFRTDPEGCAYALAVRVIRHYLGDAWVEKRIILSDHPDSFMLNELDENSENRWVHQDRVISLGDFLFLLSDARNSDCLIKRFQERETRPCFLEAAAAEAFAENRFRVEIVRESGKRGADFDFAAHKAGITLNVEVTGLTSQALTQRAIENVLNNKRNQVPADKPAVLFVTIPEAWTHDGQAAEEAIGSAVTAFFRGSKRLNAVVFSWEAILSVGDARMFAVTQKPYFHPTPRHATAGLRWLRRDHPIGDLNRVRALAATASSKLQDYAFDKVPSRVLQWTMGEAGHQNRS